MQKVRRWSIFWLGLIMIWLFVACRSAEAPTPAASDIPVAPREGARAPDFALRELGGAEVRLSELRGKVVLLNFWATW